MTGVELASAGTCGIRAVVNTATTAVLETCIQIYQTRVLQRKNDIREITSSLAFEAYSKDFPSSTAFTVFLHSILPLLMIYYCTMSLH